MNITETQHIKLVYEIPTNSNSEKNIPSSLQRLFYHLQFGNTAASTRELTKSFGWTTQDAFIQHDIQELNRLLSEALETKLQVNLLLKKFLIKLEHTVRRTIVFLIQRSYGESN